jgi:hypothetical protein
VHKIKDLLQSLYGYFSHSHKRCKDLEEVVDVVETREGEGGIVSIVKTRWISMLQPAKRVLDEYRVLVLKMHANKNSNDHALKNLELCDLQTLLGLSCIPL